MALAGLDRNDPATIQPNLPASIKGPPASPILLSEDGTESSPLGSSIVNPAWFTP